MSEYVISVTPDCLDGEGLARIPAIYEMIINAVGLHIREEGLGVDVLHGRGLTWALVRCAVEFGRRPALYESLTVDVCAGERSGLAYERYVRISDVYGNSVARAVTDWCVIDRESRKPAVIEVPTTDDLDPRPCTSPLRLRPFVSRARRRQRVGYSDCDFNGHLNNGRYVEMFYNLLPKHFTDLDGGVRLDVNFLKEVPSGGHTISYLKSDEEEVYNFCLQWDGIPACCARASHLYAGGCIDSLDGVMED